MRIQITDPPAVEPVSLVEAKAHLRVDINDEDDYIEGLIRTARQYAEAAFTHRAFVEQEITLTLDRWPVERYIELPRPPLISVASVSYTDEDGNVETLAAGTDYLVDTTANRLVLRNGVFWPTVILQESGAISIVYQAGYPRVVGVVAVDEAVGTGDDTEDTFQLLNVPIESGTVTVYLDGVATTDYTLDLESGELVMDSAPAAGVALTADYTQEDDYRANIPEEIRHALKLLVGHWHENRENVVTGHVVTQIPMTVEALLWPYRVFGNG